MDRRTYLGGLGGLAATGVGASLAVGAWRHGDGQSDGDEQVEALVAGSLLSLARDVPGARVEAHGSVAVSRLVREGLRDPDVVALADPSLFAGLAERVRLFATNALCLTYRPDAPHADAIAADWTTALERADCRVGRTDPTADPLGYRTVLGLRLAERFGYVDSASDALDGVTIQPETRLLEVLESGKLDAAFAYRNMAVEHDLPTVDLPPRVNFSRPRYADTYASVAYELDDRTVRGGPIRYALHARTDAGRDWADALLSDDARLRRHGFGVPEGYPRRWSPSEE